MNKTKNTVQVTLGVKHHFPQLPLPPPQHHACLLTVNLIIQQENCYLVIRNRGGKTFQQLYHVKIPPQSFIISPWKEFIRKEKSDEICYCYQWACISNQITVQHHQLQANSLIKTIQQRRQLNSPLVGWFTEHSGNLAELRFFSDLQ